MYYWLFVAVITVFLFSNFQDSLESSGYISPRMQVLQGVLPSDVSCKSGFDLIFKTSSNTPLCVKPETAKRLVERGWAINLQVIEKSKTMPQSQMFEVIPAASGTALNFYVYDDDLNTSPNGVDIISTSGLIEATINGVEIEVPSKMVETSPRSGKFYLRIELPDTVNGEELDQDDVVLVKYNDQSDAAGNTKVVSSSFALSKAFANLDLAGGGKRIGHEFTLRIYEPDANVDSKNEDKISLGSFEFRSGGIRTTLVNPVFNARPSYLLETDPNSNTFEVKIEIPRSIDGKTIHIGDLYEIRYVDASTPAGTSEKVILKERIG
ncbi:MAG: hypothetical protein ACT4OW_04130 [Nitrososphaerota archaeon]